MNKRQLLELDVLTSTTAKKFIKILPAKKVWLEDYKRWVDFGDAQIQNNLKMAYESGKIFSPPLDKNHDYQENYAKFGALEIRKDGIYLETELNEKGVELVKTGLYRYISPVIRDVTDTDGKEWKNVLFAVSLTNIPALMSELPDVKSQLELSKKNITKETKRMNGLALELNLNSEASESAMIQAVKDIRVQLSAKSTEADNLKKENLQLAAVSEETKKALQELQDKFNAMCDEILNAEADQAVQMAVKEGRLVPDEKLVKHYKERYKKDKEAVKYELSIMPKKVDGQKTTTAGDSVTGLDVELSAYIEKMGWDKSNKEDVEMAKHFLLEKKAQGAK